jgi:hypothetical protein
MVNAWSLEGCLFVGGCWLFLEDTPSTKDRAKIRLFWLWSVAVALLRRACGVFHFFGSDQLQEKDFPSPFSTESHFGMMTQVTAERHRCRQMPHWFGCREGARGDK